jgi:hypothetical protein
MNLPRVVSRDEWPAACVLAANQQAEREEVGRWA